ncbi:putative membrane protein [Nocardioides thalensis]|uniref:Putative membrane protein n=1 Tax=Nocardioides thalensis TaxID=1914755 RepID=A0A853C151_9ACTN|nr:putative membrane protein [Nocardioides thalensis]
MRRRDERGSVSVMIIGFGIVLLGVVAVVVDASVAFLERQGLDNLADGAALYGADMAAEGTEVYGDGLGHGDLDLSVGAARAAVGDYLRSSGAYGDHGGLRASVRVTGDTVVVTLTSSVDLPFTVPGGPGAATVSSTGSAVVRPE